MVIDLEAATRRELTLTEWIIIINVIVFIIEMFAYVPMILWLSLIPAFVFQGIQLWRLITHMFLHADFLHIFFNMYALYVFGKDVESTFGRNYFLILYFGSGLAGALFFSFMAVYFYKTPLVFSLGASAAVFGVMAAYAFLFPNRRLMIWFGFVVIRTRAKYFALGYAILELLRAIFLGPYGGVAYAAHVGGFIFGVLITFYLKRKLWARPTYVYSPVVYY